MINQLIYYNFVKSVYTQTPSVIVAIVVVVVDVMLI